MIIIFRNIGVPISFPRIETENEEHQGVCQDCFIRI